MGRELIPADETTDVLDYLDVAKGEHARFKGSLISSYLKLSVLLDSEGARCWEIPGNAKDGVFEWATAVERTVDGKVFRLWRKDGVELSLENGDVKALIRGAEVTLEWRANVGGQPGEELAWDKLFVIRAKHARSNPEREVVSVDGSEVLGNIFSESDVYADFGQEVRTVSQLMFMVFGL